MANPLDPLQVFVVLRAECTAPVSEALAVMEEVMPALPLNEFNLNTGVYLYPLKLFGGQVEEMRLTQEGANALRGFQSSLEESQKDSCSFGNVWCDGKDVSYQFHIYQLNDDEPGEEMAADDDVPACTQWMLPSRQLHGLWDTLIYDTDIKSRLLSYISTAMLFSDRGINPNIITWNRVVLLHGPPGTGKTSLCKALAQRLSVLLRPTFESAQLVEVNAHSLFSKWFSESGKLVMKMFQQIEELAQYESSFVCVLLDEVESLTAARKAAAAGTEPSDAIRVVNAVLTQIDRLKKYPNVLIMTTSNITGAIDVAFVDRADIKEFIGLPGVNAVAQILNGCYDELSRAFGWTEMGTDEGERERVRGSLYEIASLIAGQLSGRALRKLPFLAIARLGITKSTIAAEDYIEALDKVARQELSDRSRMEES